LTASQHDAIRSFCLRLLSRREHSRFELKERLRGQGYSGRAVNEVLDELVVEGWQSDERFAREYSRMRIRKGNGPLRIQHELRERGIEHAPLDDFIQDLYSDWDALIEHVHRKRFGDTLLNTYPERAKRARFLQYRGFTPEQIRTLFARIIPSRRP
jgi:regulatory protein